MGSDLWILVFLPSTLLQCQSYRMHDHDHYHDHHHHHYTIMLILQDARPRPKRLRPARPVEEQNNKSNSATNIQTGHTGNVHVHVFYYAFILLASFLSTKPTKY